MLDVGIMGASGYAGEELIKILLYHPKVRITAVAAKEDIKRYYPDFPESKIKVIYLGGAGEAFRVYDKSEARKFIQDKFNISDKYILTVTSLEWRKNVTGLLEAFRIYKDRFDITHKLVVVIGERRAGIKEIFKVYKKLSLDWSVYFLDYVNQDELVQLYNGAGLFIFPSFYEGFGLPPLEAMACGTPVVASDIPVFREVLEDSALFMDPYNPEDIANGIHRVLSDKALADDLVKKGLERIKLFSWEKTAQETMDIALSMHLTGNR